MPKRAEYLTTGAAPSTPPTGKVAIYAKSANVIAYMGADGVEQIIAASSATPLSGAWPIGAVFIAVVATDPAVLLGFGTWAQFAQGRMLVGQKTTDVDFDVAEETGGAKTIVQTAAQVGTHTHIQDAHTHTQNAHGHTQDAHNHIQDAHGHNQDANTALNLVGGTFFAGAGAANRSTGGNTTNVTATNQAATATNQNTTATNQNTTATNQNAGSGDPMTIMNPYIVVYMWKRTA